MLEERRALSSYVIGIDLGATWLRAFWPVERAVFAQERRAGEDERIVEAQLVELVSALLTDVGVEELKAIGPVDI